MGYYCDLKKLPEVNNRRVGRRKFTQSGHPVDDSGWK
jgi:hypothetical protein